MSHQRNPDKIGESWWVLVMRVIVSRQWNTFCLHAGNFWKKAKMCRSTVSVRFKACGTYHHHYVYSPDLLQMSNVTPGECMRLMRQKWGSFFIAKFTNFLFTIPPVASQVSLWPTKHEDKERQYMFAFKLLVFFKVSFIHSSPLVIFTVHTCSYIYEHFCLAPFHTWPHME